ncbi:MAG: amino acid adenylation domain-containing protein [Gemmatimonadaceae bacterium]
MAHTESELELERQRLLDQLLADEGFDASPSPIAPRNPDADVPVTFAQEVLWLLDRGTPGMTAYNTPLARRIRGPFDLDVFAQAVTALADRHESLRTVFESRGDAAIQRVQTAAPVRVSLHDVSHEPEAQRELAAIRALRGVADTAFDLTQDVGFRVAIARLAADDHVALLLTHHIVSDAWSYGVMLRELGALYSSALAKSPSTLAPPALQFGDYAAWQRASANADAIETGLGYWRSRLEGISTLELPTDYARPAVQGFDGARHTVMMSAELQAAARSLAQKHGATMYMVLLAAYATVLHRYAPQDEITVGSAVAGRTSRELENIVGYFSQALPMRVRFEGAPTFASLLHRVSETVLGAFEHQDTPLESLVLEIQRGRASSLTPSHAPLFRVVLTMQDLQGADLQLGEALSTPVELDQGSTKFDLTLLAAERAEGLELSLWYRTDLFTSGYAERFLGHLQNVLQAAIANPEQPLSSLTLLSESEQLQLRTWNATATDEGATATFASLFEAQALRVPDRLAVIAGNATLTYASLNAQASQLARELQAQGVIDNAPVGMLFGRSTEALVALLAILKAGGCYVPLSDEAPSARIAKQLSEAGIKVVVTTAALAAQLPATLTVIRLDEAGGMEKLRAQSDCHRDSIASATAASATAASASALAYVLYTSGSTGVPKGVAITNANMVHYARALSRVLTDVGATTAGDGFVSMDGWHFGLASTLAADLGNTSVLPALLSGGTLHILTKDVTTEPAKFADYMRANTLDVIKMTPNHLMALSGGKRGRELTEVLPRRWMVLGGEALRLDVARELLAAGSCRILNHYGPTETTVGVCTFEATPSSLAAVAALGAQTVPVGYPLTNTRAYVVDHNNTQQPVGVPGELLLGGDGVARGYLNRADLTAERFVQFDNDRVYRTGDRVRRLANGAIEFLGRSDDQVKVRGFRVELGEIAQAMRAHPGVEFAEVVLHRTDDETQIVAYVVAKPMGYAVSHTDRPTGERLREWASAQLPDYMVPGAFMLLERMPLTANGKVDRTALPSPNADAPAQFVAPRNEVEEQLCAIWRDVLKKDAVGVTDNFLGLGGHSLLAIRVLGKISKNFGVRLPLRTLFETPTVEALALAMAATRSHAT